MIKYDEILEKLKKETPIIVTFCTRSTIKSIDGIRITNKQFDKILPLIEIYKNDFGGVSKHYYRLKKELR